MEKNCIAGSSQARNESASHPSNHLPPTRAVQRQSLQKRPLIYQRKNRRKERKKKIGEKLEKKPVVWYGAGLRLEHARKSRSPSPLCINPSLRPPNPPIPSRNRSTALDWIQNPSLASGDPPRSRSVARSVTQNFYAGSTK